MVSQKQQILDIAMNLNRIGNWAADGYDAKQKRIVQFLEQTKDYVNEMKGTSFGPEFQPTMDRFLPEFQALYAEGIAKPGDVDVWAEKMMTWGNILTHRASMLPDDDSI